MGPQQDPVLSEDHESYPDGGQPGASKKGARTQRTWQCSSGTCQGKEAGLCQKCFQVTGKICLLQEKDRS